MHFKNLKDIVQARLDNPLPNGCLKKFQTPDFFFFSVANVNMEDDVFVANS